jgi:hypothetical protein
VSARRTTGRRRPVALHLLGGALAILGSLSVPGDGAAAAPSQGTFAGTACGSGRPASLGYCLVALSFLSRTVGYGLSAPGAAGSPLVLGKTDDAGISWSSVGHVAGLTTAAAPRPRLLFVGPVTGFAWGQGTLARTADGGAHWATISLPGRFLTLARQGQTLWAATTTCAATSPEASPAGCGVHVAHSYDAGASWSSVALAAAPFGQAELAVDGATIDLAAWEPASSDHGDTATPRLFTGSGHGTSWTSRPLPCPSQDQFPGDLATAPGSRTLWLVCEGQADAGLELYRSSTGGSGWVRTFAASGPDGQGFALDATFEELQPVSATRSYALTQRNGLLVTDDGGRHWSAASSPTQTEAMSGFIGTLDVLDRRDAWVALWATVPDQVALFHTTDGGASWASPVLAGAPPLTLPPGLPACRSSQLVAHFYGTQGGAGTWLSTIDVADDSARPCALEPPARLELLSDPGTNERSLPIAMHGDVALTAGTQVPPVGSGIAPGTQLASILVTWPNLSDANALLGGDGSSTCPVALFIPALARMTFGGHTVRVSAPATVDTPLDSGSLPVAPICGWQVQANLTAAPRS